MVTGWLVLLRYICFSFGCCLQLGWGVLKTTNSLLGFVRNSCGATNRFQALICGLLFFVVDLILMRMSQLIFNHGVTIRYLYDLIGSNKDLSSPFVPRCSKQVQ